MHGGDIYRNKAELDFSVNINPLGIPESVKKALAEAVEDCSCYPDIRNEALKQAIHTMTGADEGSILCGNGASELFCAIMHGVKPRRIVLPVPSFSGYERAARAVCAEILYYGLRKENGFCLDRGILELLTEDIDMLILANPNNPVGNRIPPGLLAELLAHCRMRDIIVVLDECFIEFTQDWEQHSYLQRAGDFTNLMIVRSFTKIFAIPGVRLGYLVCANSSLLEKTQAQLPEWNLSVFAQKAGIAAAKETEYRRKSAGFVKAEREYLLQGLRRMGIYVYPGTANYLFFEMLYSQNMQNLQNLQCPLSEELLKHGILIRDCSDYRGLSKGYYRIAVRQREENRKLLERMGGLCAGNVL